MDRECSRIQESLAEAGGVLDRLSSSEREHVAQCAGCGEVAQAERDLADLLVQAVPPPDEVLQRQIVAALAQASLRRRVLAFLPVAASLTVAVLGVAMIGGVPGSSLIAWLPASSSAGWMTIAHAAVDWQVVAHTALRSLPSLLPTSLQLAFGVLALLGMVAAGGAVRSWRKQPTWSRRR